MLAKAVGPNNNWPENRKAVFELACKSLLKEHNEEHAIATRYKQSNIDKLIDTSGQLCAILLLTGLEGFTNDDNQNCIVLDEISGLELSEIWFCLKSKLFHFNISWKV